MLPPGCPPLYCYARRSPARATIEHFRSICPIALTLDALFEAKAQVPSRPKHVPMKDTDRRSSYIRAVETVLFCCRQAALKQFGSKNWKCDVAPLLKTLRAISCSILSAFYKPWVQLTSKLIQLPTVLMAPPALFLPLNAIRNLLSAKHGEALIAPL